MDINSNLTDLNISNSTSIVINMEISTAITTINDDFTLLKSSESSTKFWDDEEDSWWDRV